MKPRWDRPPGLSNPSAARTSLLLLTLFSAACLKVTPYERPSAVVPVHFKEPPPPGWKEAEPSDGVLRGKWWEIFKDPALNALEEQVNISNQNVLQAEAQFREARAAVRIARSALFPLVAATPAVIWGTVASYRYSCCARVVLGPAYSIAIWTAFSLLLR